MAPAAPGPHLGSAAAPPGASNQQPPAAAAAAAACRTTRGPMRQPVPQPHGAPLVEADHLGRVRSATAARSARSFGDVEVAGGGNYSSRLVVSLVRGQRSMHAACQVALYVVLICQLLQKMAADAAPWHRLQQQQQLQQRPFG